MPTSNSTKPNSDIDEKETDLPRKKRKMGRDSNSVPTNGTTASSGGAFTTTRQFMSPPYRLLSLVNSGGLQGLNDQMIGGDISLRCPPAAHDRTPCTSVQQLSPNDNTQPPLHSQLLSFGDLYNTNLATFMAASFQIGPSTTTRSRDIGAQVNSEPPMQIIDTFTETPSLPSVMPTNETASVSPYDARLGSNRLESSCYPIVASMRAHINFAQREEVINANGRQRRIRRQDSDQTRLGQRASEVRYNPLHSTMRQIRIGSPQSDTSISFSRTTGPARRRQPSIRTAALPPQNLLYWAGHHQLSASNSLPSQSRVRSTMAPDLPERSNPQIRISNTNTSPSLVVESNLLTDIQDAIGKCLIEWHTEALGRHNELSSDSNASSQQRDKLQITINALQQRLQGPPTHFSDGMLPLLNALLSHVRQDGDQALEELILWLKHYVANHGSFIESACRELLKDFRTGKRFLRIVYESPGSTTSKTSTRKTEVNQSSFPSSLTDRQSQRPQEYVLFRRRLSEETSPPKREKKGITLGTKVLRCGQSNCQTCNKDSWETRQKIWRHLSPKYLKGKPAWICPVCSGLFMTRDNLIRHFDNKHLLKSSKNLSLDKEDYGATPTSSMATPATNFFTPVSYTTPSTYETPTDSSPTPGHPNSFGYHDTFAQTFASGTRVKVPLSEQWVAATHAQGPQSDEPGHIQATPTHEASDHLSYLDSSSHSAPEQMSSPTVGHPRPKPYNGETGQRSIGAFSSQTRPRNSGRVRDARPTIQDPFFALSPLPPSFIGPQFYLPSYPPCPEPPQPTTLTAHYDTLSTGPLSSLHIPPMTSEAAPFSDTQVMDFLDSYDLANPLETFFPQHSNGGGCSPSQWDDQFGSQGRI